MNKKYNILIVDVYNMMFRATYGSPNVQLYKRGSETYHLEGIIMFMKMMDSYIKSYAEKDFTVYWLFDNAKTTVQKYRKSLNENYKKTRVEQPDWFYKSLDNLELILHYYLDNSFIYRQKFLEADDYVTYIINYAQNKDKQVLLISGDQDWFRGLNSNVDQLYLENKQIYDTNKFEEEFGYKPTYSNICFYKSFYGDKSDNITGCLTNFPKLFFIETINRFNTMDSFIYAVEHNQIDFLDLGWKEKIKKETENLRLNWSLVTVVELGEIDLKSSEVQCNFKVEKLNIIYESLGLMGQIDDRVKSNVKNNDLISDMLNGIQRTR